MFQKSDYYARNGFIRTNDVAERTYEITVMLRLALTFYIFLQEHVFTIIDSIGELIDPVAQNHHTGLMSFCFCRTRQLDVELNMTVSEDEIVDVGMLLNILFSIEHQVLFILAHIKRLITFLVLDIAMFGPCQSEAHAPTRMQA